MLDQPIDGAVRSDFYVAYLQRVRLRDACSLGEQLSRLEEEGWLQQSKPPSGAQQGARGLPRRYYVLTAAGRRVALAEARRLSRVVALARERDLLPERGAT